MKKRGMIRFQGVFTVSVTIALLLFVAACGNAQSQKAETAQPETPGEPDEGVAGAGEIQDSEELEGIRVMLDWYPNAVHSFLYAAIEQGYFAQEGLEVEMEMPAETNDPLRLVAAGQVDLGMSYQPQVVVSQATGLPVVSVAAVVRHPLNALMTRAQSGITSPKDLEGKTLGYPSVPVDEAILQTMVETDGGDPTEVVLQDVGWELIPALGTGQVDAILGGYINHEQLLFEKQGIDITSFSPVDYGVPNYYELVLVASEKGLSEREELFKAFWRAAQKGQQFVVENPEAGLQTLFDHQNQEFPVEKDIEKQSLDILLPLMDAGNQPFGYQEAASWEAVGNWLLETGLMDDVVDAGEAFVNLAP